MTPLLVLAVLLGPPIELGSLFDAEALAGLPSSREPWSLLRTAEPTITADRIESGGLFSGAPALFGIHGSSWTETAWLLDGVDITDPDRGGTPMVAVPAEALEAITLATALATPSGRGSGARVALTARRPGESWRGALALHATPSSLTGSGDGVAPPIASLRGWDDASLTASGPLGAHLGLFAAARGIRGEREDRGVEVPLPSSAASLLAHLVYRPNDDDLWHVLAAGSGADRPFAGVARLADAEASEEQRGALVRASFDRARPEGSRWRASLAYQEAGETPPELDGTVRTIERMRDGYAPELYAPERRVRRFDLTAAVAPAGLRFGGRNEAEIGVAVEESSARWSDAGGASHGLTAEALGSVAARVWEIAPSASDSSAHASHVAFVVDDRLALGDSLQLEGGARFALTRGASETGSGRIAWTTLSPRIATRFTPVRAISLFAGWEQVHPRLPLRLLQWGDAHAPDVRAYRWEDDGDLRFQDGEKGVLVSVAGPAHGSIDPELRSPSTAGVVAGFDLRPGGWWIRFAGVHRRAQGLMESVNVGVTAADYTESSIDDPGIDLVGPADDRPLPVFARDPASFGNDLYLLTNPAELDMVHEGVELTVEKRVADSLLVRVGGTASRSTGAGGNRGYGVLENDPGVVGELLDQPNADTYARGRLFFDRAYTLKVAALWRPRDWSFGAVANYQDGQPFARMVIVPDLPQGAEAIPAIRRSEHRFTFTLTVDARVERAFAVGKGRVALALEAFNLLDMKNEVEEDVYSGPSFRTVTAIQPPRAVRIGVRLAF